MMLKKVMATFQEQELENKYHDYESSYLLRYVRPAILFFGVLFFLFIVPDYYLNPNTDTFRFILITRLLFLLLVIIFYLLLGREQSHPNLLNWISAYALLVSCFYLLIYYAYDYTAAAPTFFVQAMAVIVLVIIFFNVLRYWFHALLISLFLASGFIAVSLYRPGDIPHSGLYAAIVYLLIIIGLSSVSAYRLQVYKRKQFIDKCDLEYLSERDFLTGIYNRSKFDQELKYWVDLSKRYNHNLALIMFDLDDLKIINDHHGHLIGDSVIKELAGLVEEKLRGSDIFARWGGDEFNILLPSLGLEQAIELADRLRNMITSHSFSLVGKVSCSFGVAELVIEDDSNSLLSRADERLYRAKREGKNMVIGS